MCDGETRNPLSKNNSGWTRPPLEGKEVDNCQLLGLARGRDGAAAKGTLLRENPWIVEVGFDPDAIRWYEVVHHH